MPKLVFILLFLTVACASRPKSDSHSFEAQCRKKIEEKKGESNQVVEFCQKLRLEYFHSGQAMQELSPAKVDAPTLPIDPQVRFIVFYEARAMVALTYCYFQYRKWFDPAQFSPELLASAGSGFAVLKTELAGYEEWLATAQGQGCRQKVEDSTGLTLLSLAGEMGDKISVIGFNPVGAIGVKPDLEAVKKDAKSTLNHERIHALQVSCPALDQWATREWDKLSVKKKALFKKRYPGYEWSRREVAIREFLSFRYESEPTVLLRYSGNCFR